MKNDEKTNVFSEKVEKITLQGYYRKLPKAEFPKTKFINEVMNRCEVSLGTVRNWIDHGMRPANPEHVKILSEITGIAPEDLWNEEP